MQKRKGYLRGITDTVLDWFWLAVLLLLCLLRLIVALLCTPIDYLCFRCSAYRRDFPRRYRWMRWRHEDGAIYALIRRDRLPISYLRPCATYEAAGVFLHGDVAMIFSQPHFFDSASGTWRLRMFRAKEDGEETDADGEQLALKHLRALCPTSSFSRAVFFYEERWVRRTYGAQALSRMRESDTFILYRRRELRRRLREIVRAQNTRSCLPS